MVTSSTATPNPRSMTQNPSVWSMLAHVCVSPSTKAADVWLMGWSSTTQTGWSNAKLIAGYPGSFTYVCRKENEEEKRKKKKNKPNCSVTMYCRTKNISETDHISQIFTKTVRSVRGDDGDDFIFIATMGIDIMIISFPPDGACQVATLCITMLGSDLTQWWNKLFCGTSFIVQMSERMCG